MVLMTMLSHGANAAKRHLASQSNDQTSQGCLIALKQANNDLQVIGMIELALEIQQMRLESRWKSQNVH